MNRLNREQIVRLSITLAILLSGVALLPFVGMPAGAISWESLANTYTPELTVNESSGAPGSLFAFTLSDYPPLTTATVYVNGEALGQIEIDDQGGATFVLNTKGASPGTYNVTLEVDSNASATASIELVEDGETVTPPPGFEGPTVHVNQPIFLPVILS